MKNNIMSHFLLPLIGILYFMACIFYSVGGIREIGNIYPIKYFGDIVFVQEINSKIQHVFRSSKLSEGLF